MSTIRGNTPMLQQYFRAKMEHPGVLLAMRVGDFFEFYGEDAETASKELEITLTARDDKGDRVSMAGVPHHSVERYVARLIQKGYKVALCDQIEDPKTAKGLVKRKVTRVLTPGTVLEDSMLDAKANNYLVAAVTGEPRHGLSVVDVTTGEFLTTEIDGELKLEKLLQEIMRLEPAEILVPESDPDLAEAIKSAVDTASVTPYQDHSGPPLPAKEYLLRHFGTSNLRGFGCEDYTTGLEAASLVLKYLRKNEVATVQHITGLATYSVDGFMHVDSIARRHLELAQNLADGTRKNTLIAVLDQTETPMGARLLRKWIDEPLLDVNGINLRLDSVEELSKDGLLREEIRDTLHRIADLERLVSRAATGTANPRDLVALRRSLKMLPKVQEHLQACNAERIQALYWQVAPMDELAKLLEDAIVDEPPMQVKDGGIIREGYSFELDMIRRQSGQGKQFIAQLEQREREKTGINNLKVSYNAVFGYYIEIPRSQINKGPADYERKQTTVNAERYTTTALKEYQVMVSGAEERIQQLEFDLFVELRTKVAEQAPRILQIARAIAELDVLTSLAEIAVRNRYTRPLVNTDNVLVIQGGRHPVVEHFQPHISFVPNDCFLNDSEQRLIILTGPNMSGKSTWLRQNAVIALMAQIGSYVPADNAIIGLIDRIFTRVGARDELATGQSTFMVEMTETANILNNASPRSLVILDEIGRGTSTFDGLAIAWAVAESLAKIGCKTLFATHYHHLNDLSDQMEGVQNFRVAVKEQGDQVIWLHKVLPGGTDRSYGIQVARMAGIPREVVNRASEILQELESQGSRDEPAVAPVEKQTQRMQMTLFEAEQPAILDELKKLNLVEMTPIEAMMKLDEWKRRFAK